MADNKLLLKRGSDEDFLAEDDPLAELARIVGFDPEPVAKPAPAQRREPVFDLEDELLKELEIYSRPTEQDLTAAAEPVLVSATDRAPMPDHVVAPASEPTVLNEFAPEPAVPARAPAVLEAVESFTDAEVGRVYERPASHPVFDLEDEILREFAAFDARSVAPRVDRAVEAEIVHQDVSALGELPNEIHDAPDRGEPVAVSHSEGRDLYDSFFDDDLHAAISDAVASSLEDRSETEGALAIVEEPSSDTGFTPEAPDEEPEGVVRQQVADEYRAEPSDAADPPRDRASPAVSHVSGFVPGISSHASEEEEEIEQLTPSPAPLGSGYGDAGLPSVSDQIQRPAATVLPEPVVLQGAASVQRPASDYGLDELLAEVEKYPVGDAPGRWGVQSKPTLAEEVDRMPAPVVRDFAPLRHSAEAALIPDEPVAPAEVPDHSSFMEPLADIDLDAIEMALSDVEEDDFAVSPDLLSAIGGADVADHARHPATTEIASAGAIDVAVPALEDADYSSLPFDPSQIVQEEDAVEAIAEMDVPDVHVAHDEERPPAHPEYDIDLDAEMAQLFVTATAPAVSSQRSGQTPDHVNSFSAVPPKPQSAPLDLDEFERALEEDFRRSFSENRATSSPDRVPLAPASAMPLPASRSRGKLLLASAAVLIAVFGGAGVYAFMSGDARIVASSEPKIILADTDPVKVVPEDPGGKEVPNQNKAVYDRVSGGKADETRQESLLTSNEEPIDVVQRTLEPENLPMDDDAMAVATPTDDTADPRLLPDQAEQDRVTTTSKVLSGVSPRKVKTMVVRPDGSLVEREVSEEDVKQQAANDAELMKIAEKAAQDAATATDSQADDIAKTIDSVPERLSPSDEQVVAPIETNEAKTEATVTETAPDVTETAPDVVANTPAEAQTEQPAVAEAPVDQPAAAIEKTEVTPAEAQPLDDEPAVRSLSTDAQPVAADPELAARLADADVEDAPVRKVKTTKITPVPDVRPIDQPVNVVGTVTDQGTVQADPGEKAREVALVDKSAQAPVETTPTPAGSYVIQIASLPSEAEAKASYSKLSAKFGGVIGGRGVDIRKAEIKNKGTYYRVRIPAGSKQEAQNLCAQYKKAGGSCLVSK